jgi:XTP/dITP diphosphohydrolase
VELILATRNDHKALEFSRMLEPYGHSVKPLPEHVVLPPEDGETFEANALGKARAAFAELGVPVIADDSGIEAEALGGRPGVRSARFAGEDASDQENLDKLLAQAPAGSGLRYVCALVFIEPDLADAKVFFGECRGTLAAAASGDGGFGYDPAFIPRELSDGRTMGQISAAEKDALSHRGRAAEAFAQWLAGERS